MPNGQEALELPEHMAVPPALVELPTVLLDTPPVQQHRTTAASRSIARLAGHFHAYLLLH